MSDLLTTPELIRETVKEPAKRWNNRWRASETSTYENGDRHAEGDVFWSVRGPFVSKDIAESVAHRSRDEQIAAGFLPDEYLGAFPVEVSE